jgi:methylenetetrahydrofolate reductase (NADH)
MPSFAEVLDSGRFVVTAELTPPKGTDLGELLKKAEALKGWVDAFNLTDSASSIMTMAPIAAASALKAHGIEAILQATGRDRNRIALQADLLAAATLGVGNVVCMGGDPPANGDHPEAKPVFDLDTMALLRAVTALNGGCDMMGHALKGAPSFCIGAVVNPCAPDLDKEIARMEEKVEAGARFFQTQAVYDVDAFAKFMDRARAYKLPIIAGFIILKSGGMARRLNESLPGVSVPESIIAELDAAADKPAQSIAIGGRIIGGLKSVCQGVHVMAIGWEARIPAILSAAGIEQHG